MMLNDELRVGTYCQICGKKLPSISGAVGVGPTLCSECQLSALTAPSYLQTTFNNLPFSVLADEANYQYSWLQEHRADIGLDISKIAGYDNTVLGDLPSASLGAIFADVGVLQQNILRAAALEVSPINSIAQTIAEANAQITDALSSVFQKDKYLERLTDPSYTGWLNPDNINDLSILSSSVPSYMASVLGTSMAADNAFLSLNPSKLYEVSGAHSNLAQLSIHSLNDLAGDYKSLCIDLYGHFDNIMGASSLIAERPPFEIYQAGTLAEYIAPIEELEKKLAKTKEIIRVPTDTKDKILSLGKPFLEIYDGAVEAINIPLADSQRHVCVSLRELVSHTINKLAPNKEVVQYLKTLVDDQNYLHKGRPTRQGKIRYIGRKIETGSFSKFMNTDVKSTLAFIDLLQEGTHSLETPFSVEQLTALLSRTEGLLSFLIDISNA